MLPRLAALFALVISAACSGVSADTVILNGKIFTASSSEPWVQAIAIRGDRIVATGDTSVISALAGSSTRKVDVGGRTVVPGFNDAHQHIPITPPADRLNLPFDPTLDQIAAALREQIKTTAPGRLIQGEFAEAAWGNTSFTRAWLDAIAPEHPVWLTAFTGHGLLINSRALALIGLDEKLAEVEGGVVGRDERGRLNGRFEEYAEYMLIRRLAVKTDPAEAVRIYRQFAADARAFGITSIQLLAGFHPSADASKALVAADAPMRWRYFRLPIGVDGGTLDSRPPLPPQPTPLIEMKGMKWIIDGTPIERLAFMREPYLDAPSERGRLNLSNARIDQFVGWAYGSEDPLAVHAVGDAAIDAYVAAVERTGRPEVWRAKRPRLEHGDMMPADFIARIKALGMVVVQNPLHFMLAEFNAARLGPQRIVSMQPMKSLLDAGIPLAIGSDGPMNPFLNIMAATIHPTNPKEALTREQAVTAYTAGAAFAEFKEREKGQIAVGQLADLAVLSADLFTVPVAEMEGIRSVMTIFGGRIIHDSGVIH